MKFNKLSNDLKIKSVKGTRNSFLLMKNYINNGINLNKNSIDSSLKNKQIAFCPGLSFGIYLFLAM